MNQTLRKIVNININIKLRVKIALVMAYSYNKYILMYIQKIKREV